MAASEVQNKKRKGATDSQPKAKKARKSDDITGAKPVKATRKQAADFFSEDEAPAPVEVTKTKKTKKSKVAEPAPAVEADVEVEQEATELIEKPKKKSKKEKKAEETAVVEEPKPEKAKKSKKSKDTAVAELQESEPVVEEVATVVKKKKSNKGSKAKKVEAEPVVEVEETTVVAEGDVASSGDEDEALDDQTAALLAGFDSDRDESDFEKEDEDFDEDALPEMGKEISKKKRKELEKAKRDAEPGVIYLGRIPHGFFEPQMKKYFNQFGTVTRLRLSRNKKTGASKHYAFIEFANAEVADIVAKTMHNYLMFGHILQCRVVPPEQVHSELFKGANERFKVEPRNKKVGTAMSLGATRDVWEKRVAKENKKRARKTKGLQEEFGYEFHAPAVKSVDSVPKKIAAVEDAPAQQLLSEEAAAAEPEADAPAAAEELPGKKSKKSKDKKRKSDAAVLEVTEEVEVAAPKSKKEAQAEGEVVVEKKRKVSQNGTVTKKTKKIKA